MRARNVVHDNIATASCPVWRARYVTPLTTRAVRNEYAAQSMEIPELEREAWMAARLTPLDRMLTDEEAYAVEQYILCESILAGSARCGDYTGDRVQTSRGDMMLISEQWLAKLANHNFVKKMLARPDIEVLGYLKSQMEPEGPSDAEIALKLGLQGRNKRTAWLNEVKRVAFRLCHA